MAIFRKFSDKRVKGSKILSGVLSLGLVLGMAGAGFSDVTRGARAYGNDFFSYENTAGENAFRYDNMFKNNWTLYWSHPNLSYMVNLPDGGYMLFFVGDEYYVEYYDAQFNYLSHKTVAKELETFGSFCSDGEYYYVLTGSENLQESPEVECFRITKYDTSWKRVASCGLYDCNTIAAIAFSGADMTCSGKWLIARTAHAMYDHGDGLNHQANITIQVDKEAMEITDAQYAVSNSTTGYVSHSFKQIVRVDDDHMIAADLGDAYPRSVALTISNSKVSSGELGYNCEQVDLLSIPGDIGDNYVGVTLGGMEITEKGCIAVGSSIPQFEGAMASDNVFVATLGRESDEAKVTWVANPHEGYQQATPYLVKVEDGVFAVLWGVKKDYKVHFMLVNANGECLSEVFEHEGALSDCQPIVVDDNIVWYYKYDDRTVFCKISVGDLSYSDTQNNIELSEENFPDQAFRTYLKQYDLGGDGFLSDYERRELNSISVSGQGIKSLKGIELLKDITYLDCSNNNLTELDLSENPKLKTVKCSNNKIANLVVGKLEALTSLQCQKNLIVELDMHACTKLTELAFSDNPIEVLDVSNTKLTNVLVNSAPLKSLNCSNCLDMVYLDCSGNKLEALDVSGSTNLESIVCSKNLLSSVDLTSITNLHYLSCEKNQIANLNLTKCGKIIALTKRVDATSWDGVITFDDGNDHLSYDETTVTDPKFSTPTPTPTVAPTNTPKPTATPAPGQNASVGEFVERLYTVALGRPSEKTGKQFWISEITSGRRTGGDCGREFLFSQEFSNRGLSIEDFVEVLYKTFFGRASEPAGKAYWVGELRAGRKTRNDVINGFIDSTEWCNICAGYGVKSGAPSAKAEIASANAVAFATRLYTCCLGREPEEGGLKYWSLALTNLEQSGYAAAKSFFGSKEFRNLMTTNEEFVTRLYTTFMDRAPETKGFNYWVGELKKGRSRNEVLAAFAQCPEFDAICRKYGIDRGTV